MCVLRFEAADEHLENGVYDYLGDRAENENYPAYVPGSTVKAYCKIEEHDHEPHYCGRTAPYLFKQLYPAFRVIVFAYPNNIAYHIYANGKTCAYNEQEPRGVPAVVAVAYQEIKQNYQQPHYGNGGALYRLDVAFLENIGVFFHKP